MMDRRGAWLRTLAAVAVALLVVAACGADEGPAQDGGQGDGAGGGGAEEFDLVEDRRLKVGSDIPYPPFEFEKGGNITGFDVELADEIADRIRLEHDPNADWQSTSFDTIFQQLNSPARKFDVVLAAVTGYAPEGSPASEVVAERETQVDFSVPYYESLQSLTVDVTQTPDIKSVDDLPEGARVGVQRATTGAFYAEENLAGAELVGFAQAPPIYQALLAGQVDAVFNDLPVSLDAIKSQPDLEVVEQIPTGEQYAIAVSKDNTALKDAIDGALEEIFQDGTYAEIFQKYFPEQTLPDYAQE